MAVDVSRTQDVYKDAGQSVNFTTLLLNRKDRDAELEVIQDMACASLMFPSIGTAVIVMLGSCV